MRQVITNVRGSKWVELPRGLLILEFSKHQHNCQSFQIHISLDLSAIPLRGNNQHIFEYQCNPFL